MKIILADGYPEIKRVKGEHLLVINPADIHIGKLGVALETGDDYNTEIAYNRVYRRRYRTYKQGSRV